MSFSSVVKSIGRGIKDLSQLNVITYSGSLNANVSGETAEEAIQNARASGEAKLVGATTINLDGDVNQFISNDSEIDEKLHGAHVNAVQAGQRSRQSALEMFRAAISKAVGKVDIDPEAD